jgi:single-strand DNA-binding protein
MSLPFVSMECTAVADPELRFAASGTAVARIRTASNSRKQDPPNSGNWVDDKVCWLDVTCFKSLAENVAESVVKGDKLVVTGRLQTDEWNDSQSGEKRSRTAMIADTVSVSLQFRTVRHGETKAQRSTGVDDDDPFATPRQPATTGQAEDPPF